ncbi:MAG: PEP-CTERM sorting domain-containing protein, partial [Caldimonas sp.]
MPEPGTSAMLLGGLAALGFVAGRRRRADPGT